MKETVCWKCNVPILESEDPIGYRKDFCSKCRDERDSDTNEKILDQEPTIWGSLQKEFFLKTPEQQLKEYGVPPRYAKEAQKWYLSKDGGRHRLDEIPRDYTPSDSLFIHGKVGSGKSVLAAALLYNAAREHYLGHEYLKLYGRRFRFAEFLDVLMSIRSTFQTNGSQTSELTLIRDLQTSTMLVLDDIGVEKSTEWAFTVLYQIVQYRYERELPTVFTSNCSLSILENKLGDSRITSRISGWCRPVRKRDIDYRMEKVKRHG